MMHMEGLYMRIFYGYAYQLGLETGQIRTAANVGL